MALIYTATTKSMDVEPKIRWFNIKETCLAPSMASYENEKKLTLTEQRGLYMEWLNAQYTMYTADFQSLMDHDHFILTSTRNQPSGDYRGWAIEWLAKLSKIEEIDFRYGGELVDGRVNKVIVSGSRDMSVNLYNKLQAMLVMYLKSGYRLVVGDATGIDRSAIIVAGSMRSIMEVWWPEKYPVRNAPGDHLMIKHPVQHPSDNAAIQFIHRTKEMVLSGDPDHDRDVFLAFWDGQSKGTKAAIIQARKMGYDHGYVFVEAANEICQFEINSPDLEPWLIVR